MAEGPALGKVLRDAQLELAAICEDPAQEVRILAGWALGLTRLELVTREREPVEAAKLAAFHAALARREQGEPVYRIIGSRPFRRLDLALSKDTLEPRPDTETLVDLALSCLAARGGLEQSVSILDLGTGTGAIGLALLAELPRAAAVLTDISLGALETARRNATANGLLDRTAFVQSNWLAAVTGQFDLVVSNPPYIPSGDIAGLDVEVRAHDPLAALDGGPDGLAPYRAIAGGIAGFLKPDGLVAVEIGHDQASLITGIFEAFGFRFVECRRDLGGRNRALAFAMR